MTTTSGRRPRQTQPQELPAPVVDDHSATVLHEAIDTLGALRTPYWLGDCAVHLHALASLLQQAQLMLPEAVAQARDQDLTKSGCCSVSPARRPHTATDPPPARTTERATAGTSPKEPRHGQPGSRPAVA